jgi:hypothetical protein
VYSKETPPPDFFFSFPSRFIFFLVRYGYDYFVSLCPKKTNFVFFQHFFKKEKVHFEHPSVGSVLF